MISASRRGCRRRSCDLSHLLGDVGRVVVLAEHLHVAAQRQDADAVFGFAPAMAELVAADVEAEIELFALYAARFGHEEVAQLVDEDDHAQADGDFENDAEPVARMRQVDRCDQAHTQRDTSWRAQRSSSIKSFERGMGIEMVLFQHAPASWDDLGKV